MFLFICFIIPIPIPFGYIVLKEEVITESPSLRLICFGIYKSLALFGFYASQFKEESVFVFFINVDT